MNIHFSWDRYCSFYTKSLNPFPTPHTLTWSTCNDAVCFVSEQSRLFGSWFPRPFDWLPNFPSINSSYGYTRDLHSWYRGGGASCPPLKISGLVSHTELPVRPVIKPHDRWGSAPILTQQVATKGMSLKCKNRVLGPKYCFVFFQNKWF